MTKAAPDVSASSERADDVHDYLQARTLPALYLVDEELHIRSYWLPPDGEQGFPSAWGSSDAPPRLDSTVETAVREAIAEYRRMPPRSGAGLAVITPTAPAAVVRVMPLQGSLSGGYAVTVERIKVRNAIEGARRRFALSPREIDVLELVLEGFDTPGVAERLHIARSTANDHVKRMLAKTGARNRAELVARVFGWR